jgi:hypothetical protein
VVRDLAWSLAGPPLLQRRDAGVQWPDPAWFERIGERFGDTLHRLERDAGPLDAVLARRRDPRLGRYFEILWRYWLDHNPRYRVLCANLPVRDEHRTLGEFDLVVNDRHSGATLHWELAVKFYLGCGNTRAPATWWGPDRRDRLDIKTGHLLDHQTRLSRLPEAQAVLAARDLRLDASWSIVKGRLFYPLGQTAAAPVGACPRHSRGFWIPAHRFELLRPAQWLVLERRQWLAPVASATTGLFNNRELCAWWHDDPPRRPVCVAALVDGVEVERGFIVPADWETGDAQSS